MARRRTRTPAVVQPIVGPARLAMKARRRRATNRRHTDDVRQAVTDILGPLEPTTVLPSRALAVPTPKPTSDGFKAWRFRNRRWTVAVEVGLAVALSKLLILGPWILPAIGMLAGVTLLVLGAGWVRRPSRVPHHRLRRIAEAAPTRIRPAAALLLSPAAAAMAAYFIGALWWAMPMHPRPATWLWVLTVATAAAVRARRFRIAPRSTNAAPGIAEQRDAIWRQHVAGREKEAAGSYLVGTAEVHRTVAGQEQRIGWRGGVVLPAGSKGAEAIAHTLKGRIRTAYGVGPRDVMIEVDNDNDRRFAVQVLDVPGSNATKAEHIYRGSDFGQAGPGIFTHAIRADWTPALVRLFDPAVGVYHGHVSGETGGGKSEGIETLLRQVTSSGVVIPIIVDLGEASFPDWAAHTPIYVRSRPDAEQLLANYNRLIKHRNRKLGKLRQLDEDGEDVGVRKVYPIDREHPVYLLVFDEWQFAIYDPNFGPSIMAGTKDVVTQGRKVNTAMLLAGQSTGLVEGFKNSQAIRTQCQAGYMIAYRNNSESGQQVFGNNIKVDPSKIEKGANGVCFLTSHVDARDSLARTQWVKTPKRFDDEIDVPPAPDDELAILTKGLTFTSEAAAIAAAPDSPDARPMVEVVSVTAVPKTPIASAGLRDALVEWIYDQEQQPVTRASVIAEFVTQRGAASQRTVDTALAALKADGVLTADSKGAYRASAHPAPVS